MHASVLYVPSTYTQAAVHNDSQALGAPLSVANPGYYTAGIQPKIPAYAPELNTGSAVSTVSSLSTGNIGLPFYSAYATPHLAPPVSVQSLMPHSAMTSPAMTPYFSAPVSAVAIPQCHRATLVCWHQWPTQKLKLSLHLLVLGHLCLLLQHLWTLSSRHFVFAGNCERKFGSTGFRCSSGSHRYYQATRTCTGATSYRAYKDGSQNDGNHPEHGNVRP